MTAPDVRTAAQAEAEKRWMKFAPSDTRQGAFESDAFVAGAVWGAALVAPTREQIALVLCGMTFSEEPCRSELDCEESIGSHAFDIADAVLALMQGESRT